MFLKCITKKGITRLYLYESYYEPSSVKGEKGKVRQRMVESLGSLDELKKLYDDPVAHFQDVAKERSSEKKKSAQASVTLDLDSTLRVGDDELKNVGYGILKDLYLQLELDKFWKKYAPKGKAVYDPEAVFRLLVISRILFPASKKATYENRGVYFGGMGDFSLDDVYHSLSLFPRCQDKLQEWIFDHSEKICHRDVSVSYYDCTNYYFDISRPDVDSLGDDGEPVDENGDPADPAYRKRGPEKNRRPDPIIGMGLLMDKNGIPVAYDLFPGNESEKLHMLPVIRRMQRDMEDSRIILVADRGLNTSDNIYYLNGDNREDYNTRNGYVYGMSVRGADAEFREWVLSQDGYATDKVTDEDGSERLFKHKSRIYPKLLHVNVASADGKSKKKREIRADQKQMVYYSEKYAKKQRCDREAMVERAKDLIQHPAKYNRVTSAGSASYVIGISFSKKTGEIVKGKALSLDEEKIEEEAKYDGYYSVVTSELDMPDLVMRKIYRGLNRIEQAFKITKADFETRPVYVRTNEHIEAHFETCFTALVLIRLLQVKLGSRYPAGKILNALRKYSCVPVDTNTYQFVYFDEVLRECEKVFGTKMDQKYRTRLQIRRMLKY